MWNEIVLNAIKGLLIGAGSAGIGYLKSMPDGEEFDYIKAVPAVIIGGVIGGISGGMGISIDSAESVAASFGLTQVINLGWTAFMKWWKSRTE